MEQLTIEKKYAVVFHFRNTNVLSIFEIESMHINQLKRFIDKQYQIIYLTTEEKILFDENILKNEE